MVYAALSGPTGGIWRSVNTGQTWQLMLSGQATSVVLDPESGTVSQPGHQYRSPGQPPGRLRRLPRHGRLHEPQPGQVWNQMLGGIGNPLIFKSTLLRALENVNRADGPSPNGTKGRISLAVPDRDRQRRPGRHLRGWLYAMVATPAGGLVGIFVTKDFGQNWTQVSIPTVPPGYQADPAIPDYDVTPGQLSRLRRGQIPRAITTRP